MRLIDIIYVMFYLEKTFNLPILPVKLEASLQEDSIDSTSERLVLTDLTPSLLKLYPILASTA
jgi:hypothetical protein